MIYLINMEGDNKPAPEVYRVRRNSRLTEGLFLSKIIMKKHGRCQLEGMGESISLVAKIAQILSKDQVAVIEKTTALNVSENKSVSPKLVVSLGKGKLFEELTQNITPNDPKK